MILQKEPQLTKIEHSTSSIISVRNRQRLCQFDLRLFRQITRLLLRKFFQVKEFELGVHLVEAPEMTQLNEHFLRHAGSTDVITFDYTDMECGDLSPLSSAATRRASPPPILAGEIFICVTEAQIQTRRYRAELSHELVRYLIHGLLHLRGYEDRIPAQRRPMKREEERLLREITQRFSLKTLARL